jgi:deoxyribonuclease V
MFATKIPNIEKYVLNFLKQIPYGKITTYKDLAIALGDEISVRAIGEILNKNKYPDKYPCYKVVLSSGEIGGYSLGIEEKKKRLEKEGIRIENGKVLNFENLLFTDFKTDFPLKKLREKEERMKKKIKLKPLKKYSVVAGVDVSYKEDVATCCYVSMDKNFNKIEKIIIKTKVKFPYIPTYFSYREGPIILKIMKKVKNKPDVIFIDGNGILHPRNFGIACWVGTILKIPTIGVAKKLLIGNIKRNYIFVNNKKVGCVVKIGKEKIFVSPGNLVDIKSAKEIAKKFIKYKIPEPLRLAHIFSSSKARAL